MASGGIGDHPNLNLTAEEKSLFQRLYKQADTKGDGIVTGEVAISLFPKAKLSENTLGEIWAMADIENRGFLLQEDFAKAMRLIGHYQKTPGRPLTNELALQPCPPGYPKFEGINMAPGASFDDVPTPVAAPAFPPPNIQAQNSGSVRVPPLTPDRVSDYTRLFESAGVKPGATLDGDKARMFFQRSGLPNHVLAHVWNLADTEQRTALSLPEFIIAMHLLASHRNGTLIALPQTLPAGLIEAASRRATQAAPSGIPRQFSGQSAARTSSPLARQAFGPPATAPPSDWVIGAAEKAGFDTLFERLDTGRVGAITGGQAVEFFGQSELPQETLAAIWDLATIRGQEQLNKDEFAVAMYLIRDQRGKAKPELPSQLPMNLIPPTLRNQIKPSLQPQPTGFMPPPAQPHKPSAAEDLFGLDALSASPPTPVQQQTTGGSGSISRPFDDPFGNKASSPTSQSFSSSPRAPTGASHFKPFIPASSFGQGLSSVASQNTGGSGSSSAAVSRDIRSQPSAMDDLLGDNDESSRKITNDSSDLANMSNQIGILRNQMQDVQSKKTATQSDLANTNSQRRDLEQRLTQFRSQYEQEAQQVKALEEQLAASRKESRLLQQDLAVLEAGYQDLQTQHRQAATQLDSERREITSLKERMRQINTEMSQLKPQLESMRNDTRREKGMVSINKKQLEKSENERDAIKAEMTDLSRAASEAAQVPLPDQSAIASPAPSTASQKTNPFFRKSPQPSVDNTMSPGGFTNTRSQSKDSSKINNIFGPSFGGTPIASPPVTSFRGEPFPPQTDYSVTSSEPGFPTPSASPHPTEAPAPPASRQITSNDLPFPSATADTAASSVRVETPTSRYAGNETPTNAGSSSPAAHFARPDQSRRDTTGSTGAAMFDRTASPVASITSEASRGKQPDKTDFFGNFGGGVGGGSKALPGAFPETPFGETHSPIQVERTGDSTFSERSKQSAPRSDPFSFPGQPVASKSDFDSAFAAVGGPKTVNRQTTGSSANGTDPSVHRFNSEFPPIETHEGEDSDSEEDHAGFGDNFTQASPPRAGKQVSTGAKGATSGNFFAPQQPPASELPRPDAQKSPPSYGTAAGRSGSTDFPPEFGGLLPSRENPLSSPSQEAQSPAVGSRGDALFGGGGASTASKSASGAPTLSAFSGSPPPTTVTPASTTGTHSDAYHSAPTHPNTERDSNSTHKSGGGFDDFESGFDDLTEAKDDDNNDDDLIFDSQHHEGDDWNPSFDSPVASKTGTMHSERTPTAGQSKTGSDDFNDFESSFKPLSQPGTGSGIGTGKHTSDDWEDMFKNIGGPSADVGGKSGSSFPEPASKSSNAFDDNEPFGAPPEAPMPPPSAPEAPMPPKLGRTVTESSVHDVDDVKRLVKYGFPRPLVVNALEKYDYDFDKALEHLTGRR